MNQENKNHLKEIKSEQIRSEFEKCLIYVGGTLKFSKKGVPHITFNHNSGKTFSFCYFKSIDKWKIFTPWPPPNKGKQKVFVVDTVGQIEGEMDKYAKQN